MNNNEEECDKGDKVCEVNIIYLKINKNVQCFLDKELSVINSVGQDCYLFQVGIM